MSDLAARRERRHFVAGLLGVLVATALLARTHVAEVESAYAPTPPGLRVDVNAADEHTLALLDRIGPERARRIVAFREEHGPLRGFADLLRIEGIGPKTVEALVDRVTFEPPE